MASSASRTDGRSASARAMPIRWRWPPESWAGQASALWLRPTLSSSSPTRALISRSTTPSHASGRATFSQAVLRLNSAEDWKTVPIARRSRRSASPDSADRSLPLIRMLPLSGCSSRLMQRARVDLPAPLGPTTAVMERSGTCSDSPFSTALSRPSAVR